MRDGEVRVDGVRSPVIQAGPEGAHEAVLFVHGNPDSCVAWTDLVARTGEFARAVAFDMPGFGRSDKPRQHDYSVRGYGRFIAGALEQLGIDRVHLVIHDFGGPFGLTWAAEHPEAFASVALINAPPVSNYRWYLLAKVWRTPGLGELLHLTLTRTFFDLNVKRGRGRPLPREAIDRMWHDYDRGTRNAVLKLYRASPPKKLVPAAEEFFAKLDRPALVVWGRRDPYIPIRFAEAHRRAFPKARYAYLDRSGHWPFLDDPKRVAEVLIPFLEQQIQRAQP
jgi:pimeloyl-ACP methyl ester carboxylesterase